MPPFKISDHDIFFSAVRTVVLIPSTQTLSVFANDAKSNVWKKLLIPLAMDSPKFLKSKFSPNDKAAYIAVFKEPAIVFPTAPNNSGLIKPLRKSANPLPKFLAPSYTLFHWILLREFVSVVPIYSPNSSSVLILLLNNPSVSSSLYFSPFVSAPPSLVPLPLPLPPEPLPLLSVVNTFNSSTPCNCCLNFFALSAAFPVPLAKSSALSDAVSKSSAIEPA